MMLDAIFSAPAVADPDFLEDILENGVRLLILLRD